MFSSSVPVIAGAFFNRAYERERICKAIERLQAGSPQWLCLVGPRKVGKTSLLLEVARELKSTRLKTVHPLHLVVVDVLDTMPVSLEFFRGLALQVLEKTLSSEIGASLSTLARTPALYREAVVGTSSFAKLPSALKGFVLELPVAKVTETNFVRHCLDLPEQLAQSMGMHLVIAIDEFQELAALAQSKKGVDPLPLMRSIWQRHQRVAYIVSGSARSLLVELATSEHSPFFQHFTLMDVGPFSEEDAVELLVESSLEDGRISEQLARQVYRTVGGNPFYLQVMGEALTEQLALSAKDRALKESLQQELFSRTGRLSLYFANEYQRLVGRATTLALTLDCLAEGPRKLTEIAKHVRSPSGATLNYLERLGDAVIRTEEGTHQLADGTFGLWLRWRRPGGSVLPMTLVGDEGERATAMHLARLGFDLVYQSRGSRGAFDLLATRGPLQLAVQVKHRQLPLRFGKEEWQRMEADAKRYGWLWLVAAVEDDGKVLLLDPRKAKRATGIVLDARAAIDNVLAWLDIVAGPTRKARESKII